MRCPACIEHQGWETADESKRREPADVCRRCYGSGREVRNEARRIRFRYNPRDMRIPYLVVVFASIKANFPTGAAYARQQEHHDRLGAVVLELRRRHILD